MFDFGKCMVEVGGRLVFLDKLPLTTHLPVLSHTIVVDGKPGGQGPTG